MIQGKTGALIQDYNDLTLKTGARSVLSGVGLKEGAKVPFNFAIDSYAMHDKAWSDLIFNPASKTAWKSVLEDYYASDEYRTLNEQTRGDPLMSKYATANFLNSFVQEAGDQTPQGQQGNQQGNQGQTPQQGQGSGQNGQQTPLDSMTPKEIKGISQALRNQAKETSNQVAVAQGFTHLGIPIAEFLDNPDDFRNMAKDRVIVQLVRMLKIFQHTQITKIAKRPTQTGGRPRGVKTLQRFEEITRTMPTEYLNPALMSYRTATKQLKVRELHSGLPNYVIYLDKSSSMTSGIEDVKNPDMYVPKISFCTALALAFEGNLKKLGSKMTLKFFDTAVHDAITDRKGIIKALMTVRARGGTSLTSVLEDALTYRDEKIVVFTDGIDHIEQTVIDRAKTHDIHFIFIQTDSDQLNKVFRNAKIEKIDPSVLMRI